MAGPLNDALRRTPTRAVEQEAEGKGPRGGYGQAWLMPVPATIGYGLTQADA